MEGGRQYHSPGSRMAQVSLDHIKRLTLIALVSDDSLMERLVLKGGNAIGLVGSQAVRQSLDLDFSLDGDFESVEWALHRFERVLTDTFSAHGLVAIDIRLTRAPPNVTNDVLGEFWGGYSLVFKVTTKEDFERLASKPDRRSAEAIVVGPRDRKTFTVDISKFEYVADKVKREVDGYTVHVYSPLMIVCEKVRAICQQMRGYRSIVLSSSARPRARDFFDIHRLITTNGLVLGSDDGLRILTEMFRVKRVPLQLLGEISAARDFHRENFRSVQDTVQKGVSLLEFDAYVDFLVEQLRPLQARWEIETPPC
jgi:hypothetical protein